MEYSPLNMTRNMSLGPEQQNPLGDSVWSEQSSSLISHGISPGKQDLNPETWHLKFRAFTPSRMSDPIQDLRQLSELCHHWLRPDQNTKEEILDQLVLEQFLLSMPLELQVLVKESGVKSCRDLEEMLRSRQPKGWSIIILQGKPFLLRDSDADMAKAKVTEWDDVTELSPKHQSFQNKGHLSREQDNPQLQNLPEVDKPPTGQEEDILVAISEEGELEYLKPGLTLKKDPIEAREEAAVPTVQEPQLPQDPTGLVMAKEEELPQEEVNTESSTLLIHILKRDLVENKKDLMSLRSFQKSKPDSSPQGGTVCLGNIEFAGQGGLESAKPLSPLDHPAGPTAERQTFLCVVCEKSFAYKSQFIIHQRTHTGERPFHCSFCKKGFLQSSDLRVHQRIHTGERPFKCLICHKTFVHKSTLLGHRRTHTMEKPYKCERCDKYFSHKGNLNVHQRIHSDSRPYRCKVCGGAFRQQGTYKRHVKTHSKKTSENWRDGSVVEEVASRA